VVSTRHAPRPAGCETRGYTLVALIVIVAVMNVLVAASLPYWSQVVKRDKEAELIFRGLQYAEAIRVFQLRFNRLPNTLDELIEVNPRSIRQLWKDPMADDGEWEPIRAQAGQAGRAGEGRGRQLAGGTGPGGGREEETEGRRGRGPKTGPIIGVRSRSQEEAVREFMGSSSYASWQFTIELIPTPVTIPDTLLVPRPTSDWIGKPFREGLQPMQGSGARRNLGARQRQGDDDG
jgi:type II secretory pathway pseudopilin PulG